MTAATQDMELMIDSIFMAGTLLSPANNEPKFAVEDENRLDGLQFAKTPLDEDDEDEDEDETDEDEDDDLEDDEDLEDEDDEDDEDLEGDDLEEDDDDEDDEDEDEDDASSDDPKPLRVKTRL